MTSNQDPIPAAPEMTEADWSDLLYCIEQESCVVVVGPEVYTAPGGAPLEKRLAAHLRAQANQLRIRVYDNGWFHLQPLANETSPYRQVKAFYGQEVPAANETLQALARIKFPIYISLTPDNHLRQAFEGHPASFDAYVRNQPYVEGQEAPTADRPLVFQLLGNIEDRNSLILTYDDFYDYLESVFKNNSMSPVLKDAIFKAEYFLFLGIPFDQWSMHLFMRVLRQSKEKRGAQKTAVPYDVKFADSCLEQYTIRFVEQDIGAFVRQLSERCANHAAGNSLLRPVPTVKGEQAPEDDAAEPFFTELLELLEDNQFDGIYERVKKVLAGTGAAGRGLLQHFIQLKGRFGKLEEENMLGMLMSDQYHVQLNQVRKAFLDMINELRKQWPQLNIQP